MFDDDHHNETHTHHADFEDGLLYGRVKALEVAAKRQDDLLTTIDGKLDAVLIGQAARRGAEARVAALAKFGLAFLAAAGSFGGVLLAWFHLVPTPPGHP